MFSLGYVVVNGTDPSRQPRTVAATEGFANRAREQGLQGSFLGCVCVCLLFAENENNGPHCELRLSVSLFGAL